VKLLRRSKGIAAETDKDIEVAMGIAPGGTSKKFPVERLLHIPDLGYLIADFYSLAFFIRFDKQ
jgi:hypothetical protein